MGSGRRFLARAVYSYAAAGAALSTHGIWSAYRRPEITRRALFFPELPPGLDGLTVLHLSDIHAGIHLGEDEMHDLVAQANVLRKVANTGMAATNDLAPDVNDIHPPLKRQVGERLALLALSRTYGPKQVDDASPLYRSMSIDGSRVRLHFDHASLGFRPA